MHRVGLAIALSWLVAIAPGAAIAQIAPDQTLPTNSSVAPGCTDCLINGGTERGVNLYHSFREFSIPTGGSAWFNNSAHIQNILTRVTGTASSNIDGLIRANGTANLFFLNPNGIVFGPNARLQVGGSFFASTANSFQFPDGTEFSATAPQAPPLLTVSVTPGVQSGLIASGTAIAHYGNLAAGQDLVLEADRIDLQGQLVAGRDLTLKAQDSLQARDSQPAPLIISAGRNLLVQGNQTIDIFALNHPDSGLFSGGDQTLRSANPVGGDAHYFAGGTFRVEQLDGRLGSLFSPNDPIIRSQGDVTFFGYQGTSLHILAGGSVNVGQILITGADTTGDTINPINTPQLANVVLSDGTSLTIDGSARRTVDIRAGMDPAALGTPLGTSGANFPIDVFFTNTFGLAPSPNNNPVRTSADITIGLIDAESGQVLVTNQYLADRQLPGGTITLNGIALPGLTLGIAVGSGTGDAGSITVDSRGDINVNSLLSARSTVANGGNVKLLAQGNITVAPSGAIDTQGLLNGGITFNTFGTGSVSLAGNAGGVSTSTTAGKGGDIQVLNARSLALVNGARLFTVTTGNASGGDIIVNAQEAVQIIGENNTGQVSGIFANTNGAGAGGSVTLTAPQLTLRGGGQIGVNTFGAGPGGNLTINGANQVEIDGTDTTGQNVSSLGTNALAAGHAGITQIATQQLFIRNGGQIGAGTFGSGNGGKIAITAKDIQISGAGPQAASGLFSSSALGSSGNAGALAIATDQLRVSDRARLSTGTNGQGQGGELSIQAKQVVVQNGGQIQAGTNDRGPGGNLTINAATSVEVIGDGSKINTQSGENATGQAGKLAITTQALTVRDGAQVDSSSFGVGFGGTVLITADTVETSGTSKDGEVASGVFANANGTLPNAGAGGTLTVNARQLLIREGSGISVATQGSGKGGDLEINTNDLLLAGVITAATEGEGAAGNITIAPRDRQSLGIQFQADGQISASTNNRGTGGSISITAPQAVTLSGAGAIAAETNGQGRGGSIRIATQQLTLQGGVEVSASTTAAGAGGNIDVLAPDFVTLSDAELASEADSTGNAGNVSVTTGQFTLIDGGKITTATEGRGQGGSITVVATRGIDLIGPRSSLQATTGVGDAAAPAIGAARTGAAGAVRLTTPGRLTVQGATVSVSSGATGGNAGDVELRANTAEFTQGGRVLSNTAGAGKAGNLTLVIGDRLSLNGSNTMLSASTEPGSTGPGGNITVATHTLALTAGAEIAASTAGSGPAGSVQIQAQNTTLAQGSRIASNTSSGGAAGDIVLEIADTLRLTDAGTGIFASTTLGSRGNGGSITVAPRLVQLENGAQIAVDSQGSGTGGSIAIQANRLELNRQGAITAETASAQGGNITLELRDILLLRRNSLISATAGNAQAGGDGGNITITAPFVIGVLGENSDITANAFSGRGGNILINTNAIFGLRFQPQLTPFSDITASSQFGLNGIVTLNTLNVDPNRGLAALPISLVDPTDQIDTRCVPRRSGGRPTNEFVVTGGGGLPEGPDVLSGSDRPLVPLTELHNATRPEGALPSWPTATKPIQSGPAIATAQRLMQVSPGTAELVGLAPNHPAYAPWFPKLPCPVAP